jgi:oligopeptide/dipeptide ABC transporter ATP-binding protein
MRHDRVTTSDPEIAGGQMPSTPVIAVEDLHVDYPTFGDSFPALRGIDLSINAGEIVGLVGESGAGKTTLARAIMRLLSVPGRITSGRVRVAGQDLATLSDEEMRSLRGRHLAMVVPNPRSELNPLLTIGRQIGNVARTHLGIGRAAAQDLALDMLRAVRIPDPERRLRAYPHEMSGGMAQRVVIAIALVCKPRFIISDDATSGLDVTVQAQVLELLNSLVQEQQSSMLFITRDIGIAAHHCHRVAVIYRGQLMEVADRETFFFNPMHPYSVMLLAAFSYNPRLRRQWASRTVAGKPAAMAGLNRGGCSYADRCALSRERCFAEAPALREITPGHWARCHFPVIR